MFKVRCSGLVNIVGNPRTKSAEFGLTDTAKSYIYDCFKHDVFEVPSFEGNQYTQKGNICEEDAIILSGMIRGKFFSKNTERRENDFITGECDIFDKTDNYIIDIKNSWSIKTHPWLEWEAYSKAKKAGYDWQMQGYMWLWDCEHAEIDFWLLPCPDEVLNSWDDKETLQHRVLDIPQSRRVTTITYERDEAMITQIVEKTKACQEYYEFLVHEFNGHKVIHDLVVKGMRRREVC